MHFKSYMAYRQQSVTLDLDTDVTHQCSLHYTRDQHLIGIIEFNKPSGGVSKSMLKKTGWLLIK